MAEAKRPWVGLLTRVFPPVYSNKDAAVAP